MAEDSEDEAGQAADALVSPPADAPPPPSSGSSHSPQAEGAFALPPSEDTPAPATAFPVVGIGASAGGLAAFEAFFSGMPAETDLGAAIVIVQHLAPDHKSILAELIRRFTRMEVVEVVDGMKVKPNCAYIIPPNRDMAFLGGALTLLEPVAPRGRRLPIDFFFRSLAQDQRDRSICIVLSGTGSDGTLGARAVKGEGGLVMAQSPNSAEYDSMPRSAIGTGLVDFVLPPAEMPAQLMRYITRAFTGKPRPVIRPVPSTEDGLQKIFVLLRAQTGHDFSHYKRSTVHRRIERRMAVHQLEPLNDYVRFLQQDPTEVEALFQDLLIGVTSFFRDPEAFAELEDQAIPQLFAGKPPGATVRVWVPACSTGEEAYSIAILLQEQMELLKRAYQIQVFATDIDRRAIERARHGVYPASIAVDITPERFERFFAEVPQSGTVRIRKNIRDVVIFSEQNVIKDPPFSKLDFISCRNLLIYLDAELQRKVLRLLHYAPNPEGLLFLGTSETVGEAANLFSVLARSAKIYQRRESEQRELAPTFRGPSPLRQRAGVPRPPETGAGPHRSPARDLAERSLLQHYAPAAALVDARGDILYLHGRTGQYLEPSPGEAALNILRMARAGLRSDLASALHRATGGTDPACRTNVRVKTNGDYATVDVTVRQVGAIPGSGETPLAFLATFEPSKEVPDLHPTPVASPTADVGEAPVAVLRRELRDTEDYLQSINEELETSNEELKSANEEMQSVNEELQSTNEEMETSKEELQSVNEELATVNAELQQKVTDLSRVNNDMNNLLAGTGIGTIFVDDQLRIQRFTPAVTQVINLIPTDVGRPIGHIVSNLVGYDRLVEDVRTVLDTLVPRDIEVETHTGAWYSLRIRPYRTLDNVIEGVVVTFIDVTEQRRARALVQQTEGLLRLAAVVRDASDAITMHDLKGRILAWNPGAERLYGYSEAEALTMNVRDLHPARLASDELGGATRLGGVGAFLPHRAQRLHKDGRVIDVSRIVTPLVDASGSVYAMATTERPVSGESQ